MSMMSSDNAIIRIHHRSKSDGAIGGDGTMGGDSQQQQQVLPSVLPVPTSAMHGLSLLMSAQSSGLHRVILNRLHDMPFPEFELGILQIVHAVVTHRCSRTEECLLALRRLLCRLASQSLHLGVKLLWTIEAFAPNADKGSRSALEGLRELIEAAAVNGSDLLSSGPSSSSAGGVGSGLNHSSFSSPATVMKMNNNNSSDNHADFSRSASNHHNNSSSSFQQQQQDDLVAAEQEREEAMVHMKMGRASILNDQRLFFQQLVGISDFLRKVADRGSRNHELRLQLLQLSSSILQRRVFMPFSASNERPKWIVRVLPDEAVVFSSRERAPFLLVVETVTAPSTTDGHGSSNNNTNHHHGHHNNNNHRQHGDRKSHHHSHHHHVDVTTLSSAAEATSSAPSPQSGGGAGGGAGRGSFLSRRSDCGDPDVRESDALRKIGSASDNFHAYAKAAPKTGDPFGESYTDKMARLRRHSPFSSLPGWGVESLVIKSGDDLTQEQLALEVVELLHNIWRTAGVPVYVLPYRALSVVFNGGIIECVNNASSIDSLKKAAGVQTLHQFFLKQFGEGTRAHAVAQRNFIESMAGYSIVCYLMQVRDRHNGNLMLTRSGHLVHIDFGFMFGTSPGGIQFESAPFKVSQELLDTMGGANSEGFRYFKVLLHLALAAVRDNADQLVQLISVIAPRSGMKCFGTSDNAAKVAVDGLRERLALHLTNETAVARYIRDLVDASLCNWRTTRYDQFQTWQNGII